MTFAGFINIIIIKKLGGIALKYCSKCKNLHFSKELDKCPRCGKRLIDEPSHYSPVKIVTANGFELERIRSALTQADIPFSVTEEKYDTGLQILNSAPPENCAFCVPIAHYDKAVETLVGIGALDEDAIHELDREDEEFLEKSRQQENDDTLPENKARLIRIFSFLGFLAVLVGFAYLVDWLLSFVTPLLGW